jgi:hypothetical protein
MAKNNTNTNFPPHLIKGFKKLADDFETHIRADERNRIAELFRAEFPAKPVVKPPMTDMHGEPLPESRPQPKKKSRKIDASYWRTYDRPLSAKHREIIDLLSHGRFVAAPTIAGIVKLRLGTVRAYLNDIRLSGVNLERVKVNGRIGKKGYRVIYRVGVAKAV